MMISRCATHFNDASYIVPEKRGDFLQSGVRILYRIVQDGCHQSGKMIDTIVGQDIGNGLRGKDKADLAFRNC